MGNSHLISLSHREMAVLSILVTQGCTVEDGPYPMPDKVSIAEQFVIRCQTAMASDVKA